MKYFYHGSSIDIDGEYLEPRPSRVLDGEKAVFATNNIYISLVFIPQWTDNDFDLTHYNDKWYLVEQYPGAFSIFENKDGWIYSVDSTNFKSDDRLGMKRTEFISKKKVKIVKRVYIKDVLKILKKKSDIIFVTYDEKLEAIEEYFINK